jgi:uncharacterized protein YceK
MVLLLALVPLSGCGSVLTEGAATGAGIAGAGIAGAISKNATVGAAIGLGVGALADTGLKYAERRVHRTEQNAIAMTAGPLEIGVVAPWHVEHDIPIEDDEHGDLVVARTLGADTFACKEIVFSVDTVEDRQPRRAFYTAMICRDGGLWKWATAEPSTARWGGLQ